MKVAVIGAGAMGSLYGGLLAGGRKNRVVLISRRAELVEKAKRSGLLIETAEGPIRAEVEARLGSGGLGPQDLVIILVKAMDTAYAASVASPLVGPQTMVVSLQNGLGNIEILRKILGEGPVIGGASTFGAVSAEPGVVSLRGRGHTAIGEINGRVTERIERLRDALAEASLEPRISVNVEGLIWTKLLINAGINALAGLMGLENGRLLAFPEAQSLMTRAVLEAEKVAEKLGIRLETESPAELVREVCLKTKDNACSTLQDIRAKRPTEIAFINGAVAELGRSRGLSAPVNEILAALVKIREETY
ncbi:MAG: ketopantoate reductase family protein [Deltaproteobacteria bacterium]|jgi:2-dehydropantoate 2-reductase|nr:ketopantoate reductase family protein [Deltaproteobacteria bacterium]